MTFEEKYNLLRITEEEMIRFEKGLKAAKQMYQYLIDTEVSVSDYEVQLKTCQENFMTNKKRSLKEAFEAGRYTLECRDTVWGEVIPPQDFEEWFEENYGK